MSRTIRKSTFSTRLNVLPTCLKKRPFLVCCLLLLPAGYLLQEMLVETLFPPFKDAEPEHYVWPAYLMQRIALTEQWLTCQHVLVRLSILVFGFIFAASKNWVRIRMSVLFVLILGFFCNNSLRSAAADNFSNAGPMDTETIAAKILQLNTAPNLLFSPFSLATSLTLTYAGARGTTATEMAKALGLPDQATAITNATKATKRLKQIANTGDVKIETANSLWIQNHFAILPQFMTLAATNFNTEVANVDFANNPAATRDTINDWGDQRTHHKIRELIDADQFENVYLMLCNIVYFKGQWLHAFKANDTKVEDFYTPHGPKNVKMMHKCDDTKSIRTADATLLEIPYAGANIAMIICLPIQEQGLASVVTNLSSSQIDSWIEQLNKQSPSAIKLGLPKWKTEYIIPNLVEIFEQIGMTSAFDKRADFSGITGSNGIHISTMIHKAYVDVSEKGTEAAAATVASAAFGSGDPTDEAGILRIDHPFFYLIVDTTTHAIFFAGTESDPMQ